MHRAVGVAIKTLIVVLIFILLGFQTLVVSGLVGSTPGLEEEGRSGEVWVWCFVVLFVLCVQIAILCVWRLVVLVSRERIFDERAFVWVNAILVCVYLAMALSLASTMVVAVLATEIPPVMILVGIFVSLTCLALALVIVVMRALLRQAVRVEQELAEVV